MGKITSKDADKLKKSGILSEAALNEMQNKGLVSKGRTSIKRFFKTADGSNVQYMHYWRGIGGSTPSKRMSEFLEKVDTLHNEYSTKKTTKTAK